MSGTENDSSAIVNDRSSKTTDISKLLLSMQESAEVRELSPEKAFFGQTSSNSPGLIQGIQEDDDEDQKNNRKFQKSPPLSSAAEKVAAD